jgi:polysaccharide export outer membrane protein
MRKFFHTPICTAMLLGLLAAGASAQKKVQSANVSQAAVNPADVPQLKVNPLKELQEFQPPVDEAYELGAGDTINVYVAGYPELSRQYVIGPDGLITIDVAGSVKVAGLTRTAAADAVRTMLAAFYTDPSVTIGVEKYGSNTVMIFGNVQHPGILLYEGTTPTLLDAIARGGLLVNPSAKDGLPDRCIIYRGQNTVVQVELEQLLMSTSPLADIRLRRGDKIFIPIDQGRFVSVLGQVDKPGPVPLSTDLDLKMAITRAGGIKDEAGDNPTIHVVQTATNKEITIPYKQLMRPGGGKEITLQAGDVVLIPKSGFNKAAYVLTKISPVATLVTLGALAYGW